MAAEHGIAVTPFGIGANRQPSVKHWCARLSPSSPPPNSPVPSKLLEALDWYHAAGRRDTGSGAHGVKLLSIIDLAHGSSPTSPGSMLVVIVVERGGLAGSIPDVRVFFNPNSVKAMSHVAYDTKILSTWCPA